MALPHLQHVRLFRLISNLPPDISQVWCGADLPQAALQEAWMGLCGADAEVQPQLHLPSSALCLHPPIH